MTKYTLQNSLIFFIITLIYYLSKYYCKSTSLVFWSGELSMLHFQQRICNMPLFFTYYNFLDDMFILQKYQKVGDQCCSIKHIFLRYWNGNKLSLKFATESWWKSSQHKMVIYPKYKSRLTQILNQKWTVSVVRHCLMLDKWEKLYGSSAVYFE